MDTLNTPTATVSKVASLSIRCIAVVVLVGIAMLWWFFGRNNPETSITQELNTSLSALTATTSLEVPVTADPLKQATPAVNPIKKTNPFNDIYENPFQ